MVWATIHDWLPADKVPDWLPIANPYNGLGETSSDIVLSDAVLATLCALVPSMAHWTIGRALRRLRALSTAFSRIGDGDYARIAERAPLELAQICRGFNQIGHRLGGIDARNWYVMEQLAIVQEEERPERVRDLDDQIGPLLFAVDVDLASICEHKELRSHPVITPGIYTICYAVGQMQKDVRSILRRLRPATPIDHGTSRAVDDASTRKIEAA